MDHAAHIFLVLSKSLQPTSTTTTNSSNPSSSDSHREDMPNAMTQVMIPNSKPQNALFFFPILDLPRPTCFLSQTHPNNLEKNINLPEALNQALLAWKKSPLNDCREYGPSNMQQIKMLVPLWVGGEGER